MKANASDAHTGHCCVLVSVVAVGTQTSDPELHPANLRRSSAEPAIGRCLLLHTRTRPGRASACDNSTDPRCRKRRHGPSKQVETRPDFDAEAFLKSAGAARRVATYPKGKVVFSQGQPSDTVMYVQKGGIKISVLSRDRQRSGRGDAGTRRLLRGRRSDRSIDSDRDSHRDDADDRTRHREGSDASAAARRADVLGSVHLVHAGEEPPHRSRSGRSPLQLQREAAGADASAAGAVRRSGRCRSGGYRRSPRKRSQK